MTKVMTSVIVAAALAMAALAGEANAGPSCNTGGGYRASAQKVAAVRPAAPRVALASKPAQPVQPKVAKANPTSLGGGDGEDKPAARVSSAKPVVESAPAPAPVAAPQTAAVPAPAASEDYTSVSAITARLAAMSTQQRTRQVVE